MTVPSVRRNYLGTPDFSLTGSWYGLGLPGCHFQEALRWPIVLERPWQKIVGSGTPVLKQTSLDVRYLR